MYFESEVIARFMMYDSTSENKLRIRINFTNTKLTLKRLFSLRLKYFMFLKRLSDDLHDRQNFAVTLVISEVTS